MATSTLALQRPAVKSIFLDLAALAFIYFIPTLSHLFALPVYFIEPMRLMVILAMVHTQQRNAYILALTLPIFSFIISAHPSFYKTLLITGELVLNVWLFYYLVSRFKNTFGAMVVSIIASKAVYYLLKFFFIQWVLIDSGLISTPIYFQLIMTAIFAGYAWLWLRNSRQSN